MDPDDVTDLTQQPGAEITGLVGVYHANRSWHGEATRTGSAARSIEPSRHSA